MSTRKTKTFLTLPIGVQYLIIATIILSAQGLLAQRVARNGASSFSCGNIQNCSCTTRSSQDFEVKCPIMYERVTVIVRPHEFVHIECSSMNEANYLFLPNFENIHEKTVQIKKCPLPYKRPIKAILDLAGLRRITSLYFRGGRNEQPVLLRDHFRGLEELETLDLRSSGISDIPENVFADLTKLKRLDLRSNSLKLPKKVFNGLPNLEQLELGSNNIESLHEGIFSEQKNLIQLNIWGNRLRNLTANVFDGAISLADLDISSNGIENFNDSEVFSRIPNLKSINLSGNRFVELPEGLFSQNRKLKLFRFLENRVPMITLPNRLLSNMNELESVLIKCELKTLPGDLFANSSNIRNISLAHNNLDQLPTNLLMGQTQLLKLDLSFNKLHKLDDDLLININSLQILDLANNKLTEISRDIFGSLKSLKVLRLENNQLHMIHSNAFITSASLEMIHLENNRLEFKDDIFENITDYNFELASPFQNLANLKYLNLRNNSISHILRDLMFSLTRLEELDLSYNNISQIFYSDLQFLSKQINVNLTNNSIRRINFSFLDLKLYEDEINHDGTSIKVFFENNPLICDCNLLYFVEFIKRQRQNNGKWKFLEIVVGNLTCSAPESMKGLLVEQLDEMKLICPLDLPDRPEKSCPNNCSCWLRTADRALIVDCSNLGLTKVPVLPSAKEKKMDFTELYIDNNQIRKLPSIGAIGYDEVRQINATKNNISTLEVENIPPYLSMLDLSDNKLNWVNQSVLIKLQNTTELRAVLMGGKNKWQCDCELLHFLDFVQNNFKKISDLDALRCQNGAKMSTLLPTSICPRDELVKAASISFAIICLLVGVVCALYYKYQQEIKVWLYAHNWCLWFVTEDELDKEKIYDAFISYSHKDEDFVADHLVPNLENGPIKYSLCLHERHWKAGEFIPNQIIKSVEDSRRTIVVLSPNFLKSIWGKMEFRAAHTAALKEGRTRVIVIIYEDIGDTEKLDSELKAYLKMNTYIKWGDPWFWQKLRYALPHPRGKQNPQELNNSKDDKIELTKPSDFVQSTTPPIEKTLKNVLTPKFQIAPFHNEGSKYVYENEVPKDIDNPLNGVYIISTKTN